MTFLILVKSPKARLVFNHHIKILTDLKNKYYSLCKKISVLFKGKALT